jgi:hypothetical protein
MSADDLLMSADDLRWSLMTSDVGCVLSRSFELTEEFGFPVPSPGAISLESA